MRRLLIPAVGLAALFLPFQGIRLGGYVLGITGELSVTTILVLALALLAFAGGPKLLDRQELATLAAFVLPAALFLYPMALGLTSFDPYVLGYPDRILGFLLALAPVALFAFLRGRLLVLLAIGLAIAAFRFELLESRNLWDYLLDPWLALYLAGFTIFARFSKSR